MTPAATLQKKVVAIQDTTRATLAPVAERDFWMQMRHSLLMQLAAIEKFLGVPRRCKNCGCDL